MTQKEALEILKMGYNVYLTGPAGSGKTFLLNEYVDFLKSEKVNVGVTASTGIAATHMNGTTIHSWSGLGIKDELTKEDLGRLLKSQFYQRRFKKTKVLILDEISMLQANRLDLVNVICQAFKKSSLPFGGIQIIFSGDFFQLPPINKTNNENLFAYTSKIWNDMDLKICYLTEQYRQEDNTFLKALNDIRAGKANQETVDLLMTRFGKEIESDITPIKLFTHNFDADIVNKKELEKIYSEAVVYSMQYKGPTHLVNNLVRGCLAPEKLILKKGAIVMFLKNNFKDHYVNGTVGKVVDFCDDYPLVKIQDRTVLVNPASWELEEFGKTQAAIVQLPLRLAWAITVHKSQGMNLDIAEIDLSKSFTYGMGYVALSRLKKLTGIKLLGLNEMALKVDKNVIEIDKIFFQASEGICQELEKMDKKEKESRKEAFLLSLFGK